jgi:uncharacterized OB-fold protein
MPGPFIPKPFAGLSTSDYPVSGGVKQKKCDECGETYAALGPGELCPDCAGEKEAETERTRDVVELMERNHRRRR